MNVLKFYFFSLLALVAVSLAVAGNYLFGSHGYLGLPTIASSSKWLILLVYVLRSIPAFAPLQVANVFGEGTLARNSFFIYGTITILSLCAFTLFDVNSPFRLSMAAGHSRSFASILLFMGLIIVAAYLIGCFAVRDLTIRGSFRLVAWLYIAVVLALGIVLGMGALDHWAPYLLRGITTLFTIPNHLALALLLYHAWNKDPAKGNWEAAVDTIGTPEKV